MVIVAIFWVIVGEVPPFVESERRDKEHHPFDNVVDCQLGNLPIGFLEEEVSVKQIEWKHQLDI